MIILYTSLIFGIGVFLYYISSFIASYKANTSDFSSDTIESINQVEKDAIQDNIAMLEMNVERRKEVAAILEKELVYCNDKRKAVILSRLNTLDTQTFNDIKKINKLYDSLE